MILLLCIIGIISAWLGTVSLLASNNLKGFVVWLLSVAPLLVWLTCPGVLKSRDSAPMGLRMHAACYTVRVLEQQQPLDTNGYRHIF